MNTTDGLQIKAAISSGRVDDLNLSDRALNYAFMKEFLMENEDEWVLWVSLQLGYESKQDKEVLIEKIDKLIKTATTGNKFGI
jgi:hypothetical protein